MLRYITVDEKADNNCFEWRVKCIRENVLKFQTLFPSLPN